MDTGDVLWDNTTQDSTTDPNMGYVLGAVRIRKGNGDQTYVLVPNGIDSPNHSATLFVYELGTGGALTGTSEQVAGHCTVGHPNCLILFSMVVRFAFRKVG